MADGGVINTTAPAPELAAVLATGLFAVLVASSSFAYLVTGRRGALSILSVLGTIIHEAGHASIIILTGGGVYRFRITSPDSGSVLHWIPSRFSSIATSFAGYAMPSLAGLGAALLLQRGHAPAVLTLTVVTMVLLMFVSRDLITLGSVFAVGTLAFATLYWGPPWLQGWFVCAEAWLLLLSEIGGLATLVVFRVHGNWHEGDDAEHLAADTKIPSPVWIAGWSALVGWGLWNGVPLLFP